MNKYILLSCLILIATACVSQSPHHQWLLIDDFEQQALVGWINADTRNDTQPRVENPQITEVHTEQENGLTNRYLIKKPAADGVVGNRKALSFKALPVAVAIGETYTFYARINVERFPNNHVFGVSNLMPEEIRKHDYNAFEATLRVTDKTESSGLKNNGALMVKVDGAYDIIQHYAQQRAAQPLVPGTWYEIWYVVNNSVQRQGGQTYDVYVRGGEFTEQTLVYKNAMFRMKRELPLIYFLANCNTGPINEPYGNGGLLYDDLYMSKNVNLGRPSNPGTVYPFFLSSLPGY